MGLGLRLGLGFGSSAHDASQSKHVSLPGMRKKSAVAGARTPPAGVPCSCESADADMLVNGCLLVRRTGSDPQKRRQWAARDRPGQTMHLGLVEPFQSRPFPSICGESPQAPCRLVAKEACVEARLAAYRLEMLTQSRCGRLVIKPRQKLRPAHSWWRRRRRHQAGSGHGCMPLRHAEGTVRNGRGPLFRVRPQHASKARGGGSCSRRRLVGTRVNARHRGVRSETS